jgi:anti-sigma B factor antagonist
LSPQPDCIAVETVADATVVRFVHCTSLDDSNIHDIGAQLLRLVEEEGHRQLHLDFGPVAFLTSIVLGKLIALHRRLAALDGRLVVFNVSPLIYQVFAITRLDTFLDIRLEECPSSA